jgi:hypothetical protein
MSRAVTVPISHGSYRGYRLIRRCAQGCDAIYGKDGNNGIVGLIIKTYQRIKKWEKPPQS